MTFRLRYAVRSHVGNVREGNEDSAFAGSRLAVVADGMGGHAAGEVASSAAISALAHLDEDEVSVDLLDALAVAVQEANDQLREMVDAEPGLDGMGTTLTVLLASGSRLGVAHVGDSRAYLLRDGELTMVTHDQTLVQRMVDEGQITLEQAAHHPRRALLTQALDGRDGVEPDLSLRELRRGDRYLLCSDGLSGVVHEETIAETLQLPDSDTAAERLIELALKGGGPDNVTVVVADVVDEAAGLSDTPIVAGAAAEKDSVPGAARLALNPTGGHLASAAERARKLLPGRRRGGSPSPGLTADAAEGGAGTAVPATDPPDERSDTTGIHRIAGAPSEAPPGEGPGARPVDPVADTNPRGHEPVVDGIAGGPLQVGGNDAPGSAPRGGTTGLAPDRPLSPDEHAAAHRSGRRRGGRRTAVFAGVLIVLVLVLGGLLLFARSQWYVGESAGRVALYQGLKSKPLGLPLSSVEQTYYPLACLQPVDQTRIRNGYIAQDRADATRFVVALRALPAAPASPRVPPDSRTGTATPPGAAPTLSAECSAGGS
ncbi:MAG: family protein phosphatase [Frankiaceae bacterium]|nr:family protein phosphatase [Frankiaceae bacterium]